MLKRKTLLPLSVGLSLAAAFWFSPRHDTAYRPEMSGTAPAPVIWAAPVADQAGNEAGVAHEATVSAPDAWTSGEANSEGEGEGEDVLESFARWAGTYVAEGNSLVRDEMEERGIALAAERRTVLKQMIRDDPRAAIASATPPHVRERLPAAVLAQLETVVSGRGDFDVYGIVPDKEKGIPERLVDRKFRMDDRSFDAFVYGRAEATRTVGDLFLHGIAIDRDLAVNELPVRVLGAGEAAALGTVASAYSVEETPHDETVAVTVETRKGFYTLCCQGHLAAFGGGELELGFEFEATAIGDSVPTIGAANILVMLAVFPEDTERPNVSQMVVSREQASETMARVNRYFQDSSYRQFHFDGIDITNQLTLPEEWEWYFEEEEEGAGAPGADAILAHARAAATEEGFFLEYDFAIVVFPNVDFPWAGLGFVGAKGAWAQGNFSEVVVAHELGHNFGLWHANYWEPSGPALGSYPFRSGRVLEYGNTFDVMGGGGLQTGHFNGNFKNQLGWIPEANLHEIGEGDSAGLYRVHRLDGGAPLSAERKQTLRIGLTELQQPLAFGEEADGQVSYWIDFRQLFSGNDRLDDGVLVQWGQPSRLGSRLLNMHRGSEIWPPSVNDGALRSGETFYDRQAEVLITPIATAGVAPLEYVDVAVTRGTLEVEILEPIADFSVINPDGALRVGPGEKVLFRVAASASGSPVAEVDLWINGQQAAVLNGTDVEGEFELSHSFAGLGLGDYKLEARARNENGNSVASIPLSISVSPIGLDLTVSREVMPLGEGVLLEAFPLAGEGAFERIEFFAGQDQLAVVDESPFQLEWIPSGVGVFSLRAIAYDLGGEAILSETVELVVHSLVLETSADPVYPGQGVMLSLKNLLGERGWEFVDFFANGRLIRRDLTPPYGTEWVPTALGEYELTVVARDGGSGIDIEAAPVMVRVIEPIPPAFRLWPQQVSGTQLHLNGLAFSGDRFTAVGANGTVTESLDGIDWLPLETGTTVNLKAVGEGLGGHVAVGDFGTALISVDRQTWTPMVTQTDIGISSVTFENGLFVAVGDGGRVRTLTHSGGPWVARTSGTEANLRGIAYGNGNYVAVGDGGTILTSGNGTTWTVSDSPTSVHLRGVAFGNSQFVAVGGAWDAEQAGFRAVILTSPTGETWSIRDADIPQVLYGIAFGNEEFVAVGGGGSIIVSADGIGWFPQSTLRNTTLLDVAYGAGEFVAVGRNGATVRSGPLTVGNWLAQHYSREERDDPEVGGVEADPGGTGIPNLLRYAFGLDPARPERSGLPQIVIWENAPDRYPGVVFTKMANADDVAFVLEASTDLSSWEAVAETETVSSALEGNKETILLRRIAPLAPDQAAAFFRLRVNLIE